MKRTNYIMNVWDWCKKEAVLSIAIVLAVISAFFVHPVHHNDVELSSPEEEHIHHIVKNAVVVGNDKGSAPDAPIFLGGILVIGLALEQDQLHGPACNNGQQTEKLLQKFRHQSTSSLIIFSKSPRV